MRRCTFAPSHQLWTSHHWSRRCAAIIQPLHFRQARITAATELSSSRGRGDTEGDHGHRLTELVAAAEVPWCIREALSMRLLDERELLARWWLALHAFFSFQAQSAAPSDVSIPTDTDMGAFISGIDPHTVGSFMIQHEQPRAFIGDRAISELGALGLISRYHVRHPPSAPGLQCPYWISVTQLAQLQQIFRGVAIRVDDAAASGIPSFPSAAIERASNSSDSRTLRLIHADCVEQSQLEAFSASLRPSQKSTERKGGAAELMLDLNKGWRAASRKAVVSLLRESAVALGLPAPGRWLSASVVQAACLSIDVAVARRVAATRGMTCIDPLAVVTVEVSQSDAHVEVTSVMNVSALVFPLRVKRSVPPDEAEDPIRE